MKSWGDIVDDKITICDYVAGCCAPVDGFTALGAQSSLEEYVVVVGMRE